MARSLWPRKRLCGRCRVLHGIGVVGRKRVQISQLTKATLDVRHVDLDIILEATGTTEDNGIRKVTFFEAD